MTQDKTDKENFILHRGLTRNRNTGPSRDHTTGRGKILQLFNVLLSFTFILFQASTSISMVMSVELTTLSFALRGSNANINIALSLIITCMVLQWVDYVFMLLKKRNLSSMEKENFCGKSWTTKKTSGMSQELLTHHTIKSR